MKITERNARGPVVTLRQAQLMRRMAWRNIQPRTAPSTHDERLVPIAVRMLTCVAVLNYAMCGLEEELAEAGMLRHAVKRQFVRSQQVVQGVHQQAFEMLGRISSLATRQYNDELQRVWSLIDEAVLLAPPERSYNIVVALCRLVERLNRQLSGRYDFAPARSIYRLPAVLEVAGIRDYRIDTIIDRVAL